MTLLLFVCSEYAAANITTNLYVISQSWLYSLAWCSGVHSVTTNAPQLLSTMSAPLFLMVTAQLQLVLHMYYNRQTASKYKI